MIAHFGADGLVATIRPERSGKSLVADGKVLGGINRAEIEILILGFSKNPLLNAYSKPPPTA